MSAPVLDIADLTRSFGGVMAVNGLNMAIPWGTIAGLIGPNGAGKTTAFNMISGFYRPDHGRIVFQGRDITSMSPHRICRLGIARTFQNIRLFGNATALENVMVGCHVRRTKQWWMPLALWPGTAREEREIRRDSEALIERLDLGKYAGEKAVSLPYGAQRRLEIARALATRPAFLLLDEPAAGMNPQESEELMHFIKRLRDEFDLTILLIEHDMKVVMGVCERIWVLEYGRLIAEGTAAAIRDNPKVIEAYLGDSIDALDAGEGFREAEAAHAEN
ncbi:MAG: ABC transporter ATP-binding protein [Planctomycetota bacterium]|jgi:branched-chain amino acid transport system ATP-binding protein|nr:ABC transporter ATP-binding protein [Planctomycetota bacterium]